MTFIIIKIDKKRDALNALNSEVPMQGLSRRQDPKKKGKEDYHTLSR